MNNKKRLLLVTNRFHPQVGGAELNIFMQAQELGKHFDVDVYTPMRDHNLKHERVEEVQITRGINLLNLKRHYPDLATETICPGAFIKTILGTYDIVHCFPSINRNNILVFLAAKMRGIPIFLTMFDLDDYSALLESGMTLPQIFEKQEILSKKKTYVLSIMNAIFTISSREKKIIQSANPNTFLSTVPIIIEEYDSEVEIGDFKRRYHLPDDVPLILCLGRVAKIKGQDILVKSLPLLRQRTKNFHVAIVGRTDYEPDYVNEMKKFIEFENLTDHVTFTEVLPRQDVIAALKSCDIHVLPVRFMNSGAVVVETWAAVKPVLHSNMIDPCYVMEGENGFTFDVNDPEDLCNKLITLLDDPSLRKKMGANGRKLVEEKFLYPHLIRQYMEVYQAYGGVQCL